MMSFGLNSKKILVLPIGIVVFSALILIYFLQKESFAGALEVKKMDVTENIFADGMVVAAEKADVGFKEPGVVSSIEVEKGSQIKAGDVLARLDSANFESQLKHYQARADLDRAKLTQLLAGTRDEEIALVESKIKELRVQLSSAEKNLENQELKSENNLASLYEQAINYTDTVLFYADEAVQALASTFDSDNKFQDVFLIPDSQKKSEAEWASMFAKTASENIRTGHQNLSENKSRENIDLTLSNFRTNLEVIRSALNKTNEVLSMSDAPLGKPSLDTYKTTLAVQRAHVNEAQGSLLELSQKISGQKIENQVSLNQLEASIKEIQASLQTAESELALKKAKPRETELALYQAQIKESISQINLLSKQIQESVLVSPLDGMISEIYVRKGEILKENQRALSIAPLADIQVEAVLNSVQTDKVNVGDQAEIFLSTSGAAKTVKAKVASKGNGKIRLVLESQMEGVQLGDTAKVVVVAVLKKAIIAVPENYVFRDSSSDWVYAIENGKRKAIAVLAGARGNGWVEISDGLAEGIYIVK